MSASGVVTIPGAATISVLVYLAKLSTRPMDAEPFAARARKAERNTEKVYRRALAELFRADKRLKALRHDAKGAEVNAMIYIMEVFKRREVYRHLSNAADRLEHAGILLVTKHLSS